MSDGHKDARCRIGNHHYLAVMDDNPELRGQDYLECTRRGQVKDIASYSKLSMRGATGQGIEFG